ncbi:MAG: LysR family transcriptional regulator [Gemmatimonadaceae bacterium]
MAHDIDITALRSFAAAARAGSLSRAALALGTTQPAVSQHLRRLEAAVGCSLFERTTRGVTLTPTGDVALRYAERVLAITADLRGLRAPLDGAGRYRVGLLEHAAAGGLAAVLADFAAVHPGAVLDVVVADSRGLRAHLEAGTVDLAVGDPGIIGAMAGGTCRRAPFPLTWAAHPRLPLTSDPLPLVLFRAPCAWRDAVIEVLAAAGRRWRPAFEASSLAAVQAAVQAGLGIAALLPGTLQPGMVGIDDALDVGLPAPPSVELGLYRRCSLTVEPVLDRLEDVVWRTLG